MSYFGISYGTYLGSVDTTLFPDRSDRFLIDSATGPGGWDSSMARMFGQGVEDRFPDFAQFAAAHPEYGLGATPGQVRAKYFEFAARLDAKPSSDGYTGQAFRFATFANLYHDRYLPQLAEIWRALDTGNPVPGPAAREQPSGAAGVPADNYLASQLHVICNDSDWQESVRAYQRNVAIDRLRYPMFGARKLRQAFGHRARMVTADQGGHLAYLFLDNQCANDIATTFLVTGKRPHHDLTCRTGPA